MSCFCPSAGESAQMLTTPTADSTITAASSGQFVAMASFCQSFCTGFRVQVLRVQGWKEDRIARLFFVFPEP
jgi:hypothetical protein